MDYILCGRYFSADILPKHLFIESGNNKLKSRVLFFPRSMPIVLRRWPSERCWQCWLSLIASLSGSIVLRFCHRLFVFVMFVVDIVHFFYFPYCSTVSTTFGLPQLSAYWKVIQFFYLKSWLLEKHFRLPSANQLMLINEHWDYFLPRPGSTLIYSPTFFHLYRLHVL